MSERSNEQHNSSAQRRKKVILNNRQPFAGAEPWTWTPDCRNMHIKKWAEKNLVTLAPNGVMLDFLEIYVRKREIRVEKSIFKIFWLTENELEWSKWNGKKFHNGTTCDDPAAFCYFFNMYMRSEHTNGYKILWELQTHFQLVKRAVYNYLKSFSFVSL